MIKLDDIDKKLLSLVQVEFPLSKEPFRALGLRLGTSGNEVLYHIERLKAEGIIRQIGPVFDAKRIGYQTTLVGMWVAEAQLARAAQVIEVHPGVSHGYERDHDFNFWFTLAMPDGADMESELQRLGTEIEAKAILNLPALRVFKIRAFFDLVGDNWFMPDTNPNCVITPHKDSSLSLEDSAVINELQQDLPLTEKPFEPMAARLEMDVNDFLNRCQLLKQRRIMRRFSASVRHGSLGFTANAMTCWKAPPGMVENAGKKIAMLQEVSHCYERKTNLLWPYNLFAMIHADKKQTCWDIAGKLSQEIGLDEYMLLFSTREFKKVRIRYSV